MKTYPRFVIWKAPQWREEEVPWRLFVDVDGTAQGMWFVLSATNVGICWSYVERTSAADVLASLSA